MRRDNRSSDLICLALVYRAELLMVPSLGAWSPVGSCLASISLLRNIIVRVETGKSSVHSFVQNSHIMNMLHLFVLLLTSICVTAGDRLDIVFVKSLGNNRRLGVKLWQFERFGERLERSLPGISVPLLVYFQTAFIIRIVVPHMPASDLRGGDSWGERLYSDLIIVEFALQDLHLSGLKVIFSLLRSSSAKMNSIYIGFPQVLDIIGLVWNVIIMLRSWLMELLESSVIA